MKNKIIRFKPQKSAFKVTGFILMWALSLVVAAVFSQALRNAVSYVFLIIICALPFIDVIYTLIAALSVSAKFSSSAEKAEKGEPVDFSVTLLNRFVLPLPFTEAELVLPDVSGAPSFKTYIRIPLSALGKSEYKKSIAFPYKGEYSCGIKYVYVSGLFRFFRIKKAVPESGTVTVLPRRISAPLPDRNVADSSSSYDTSSSGTDRAEITEIKEYVPGDPIRNIHWKLSTKVEELMTKHFGAENGLSTCVIADTGMFFPLEAGVDADVNEFCDDAICEICCSIISSAVYDGRKVALVYKDTHKDAAGITRKQFESSSSFEVFLPYYAACVPAEPEIPAAYTGHCADGVDNDIVYVTSRLTEDTVTALYETQSANRAVTLVLFEPYSKFDDAGKLKNDTEACLRELASAEMNVQRISEKELR